MLSIEGMYILSWYITCYRDIYAVIYYSNVLTLSDSSVNQFAKLLSASPAQALSLITGPEKRSLQSQLAGLGEDEATEECFIQAALEDLKVVFIQNKVRILISNLLKVRELELMQAQAVHFEVEKVVTGMLKLFE